MAFIEWTEEMETGVPFVDKDHETLVNLINQLHDAIGDNEEDAVLGSVLNALCDYTDYHFTREEKLQEVARYPGLEVHRQRHRDLTRQVAQVRDRYRADSETVKAGEVLEFLRNWLVDHIMDEDMSYRPFVLSNAVAIKAAEDIGFEEPTEPEEKASPLDWVSLRVLVVDDNDKFRKVAETIFQAVGVPAVFTAASAAEGLEVLDARPVDLVLCDWRMDEMDGLQFVEAVRAKGSRVRILMCTGYNEPGFAEKAEAVGVDGFVEKPITPHGLLQAVTGSVMSL